MHFCHGLFTKAHQKQEVHFSTGQKQKLAHQKAGQMRDWGGANAAFFGIRPRTPPRVVFDMAGIQK